MDRMSGRFSRPRNTTANPQWYNAERAIDLVPELDHDAVEADRFVQLAGQFYLTQGGPDVAGRRLNEVWLPWQEATLRAVYQTRESFILMGKGSAKSATMAAAAIAYVMKSSLDRSNMRGLVLIVASSLPTAKIVFDHISNAILYDDDLRPLFRSNVQSRSITHITTGITIQTISCSMDSAVGRRPIFCIVDELHEVAKLGDSTAVLNQLRQGGRNWGAAFKFVSISTMPPGDAVGEFDRLLKYARAVRDGSLSDDSFLPVLYEFPVQQRPELDPNDPKEWWRGMPSLRTATQPGTMDAAELERELKQSLEADDRQTFSYILSQRLGIQSDLRDDTAETILRARWPSCHHAGPIQVPNTVAIGIDAGGLDDPMAVCVVQQEGQRGIRINVEQHLAQVGYDRAPGHLKQLYDEAIAYGTLKVYQRTDDLERAVIERCVEIARANMGTTVCGGDEHGRSGFKGRFENEAGMTFNSVPQNFLLGAALRSLEARLDDGEVLHNHCPLMAANVRNLLIHETPGGNLQLRKRDDRLSGQGYAKIDGIIAAINATFLLDRHATSAAADVSWMVA